MQCRSPRGFVVFGEELPGGGRGVLQVAAFASLIVSAAFLARVPEPTAASTERGRDDAEEQRLLPGDVS